MLVPSINRNISRVKTPPKNKQIPRKLASKHHMLVEFLYLLYLQLKPSKFADKNDDQRLWPHVC